MNDLRTQLEKALASTHTIERELGGGGMSRTYLATEVALDRRVVIKVLAPELLAGLSVERFRREILLAAKLQHPHVVPVLTAVARRRMEPFLCGKEMPRKWQAPERIVRSGLSPALRCSSTCAT